MTTFCKSSPLSPSHYAYEAAGLAWLREAEADGGVSVVEVLEVDERSLTLERLQPTALTREGAARFGRALARTHDAGAPGHGCGPPGFEVGTGFLGASALELVAGDPGLTWGAMVAEHRLAPVLRRCRDSGRLDADDAAVVDALARRLASGVFDDDAPPARLHGDLWAGNLVPVARGEEVEVVLIDPAAGGGHRLTDLALLDLFGCPHLASVLQAYDASSSHLPEGWRELLGLHAVPHLLVHVEVFGGGYVPHTLDVIRRYL